MALKRLKTLGTLLVAVASAAAAADKLHFFPLIRKDAFSVARNVDTEDIDGLYQGYGTHYVDLWVGCDDPQRQTVIVDTGSSITGFPCSECNECGSGYHLNPLYLEANSSCFETVSCNDCQLGYCFSASTCSVSARYAEGSSWSGFEAIDQVSAGASQEEEDSFDLRFACQTSITGLFWTQLADGILGMNQDENSFWYQMYTQGVIGTRQFSLCFNLQSQATVSAGVMVMDGTDTRLHTTPMVYAAQLAPFGGSSQFVVGLKEMYLKSGQLVVSSNSTGANITNTLSSIELQGSYRPIVDSGTTCTYLPRSLRSGFLNVWSQVTDVPFDDTANLSEEQVLSLPTIVFQLQGQDTTEARDLDSSDILVAMPPTHYLRPSSSGGYISCLYFTEYDSGVLGANFIAGHDVFFDVENSRMGFTESTCDYEQVGGNDTIAGPGRNNQTSTDVPRNTDVPVPDNDVPPSSSMSLVSKHTVAFGSVLVPMLLQLLQY